MEFLPVGEAMPDPSSSKRSATLRTRPSPSCFGGTARYRGQAGVRCVGLLERMDAIDAPVLPPLGEGLGSERRELPSDAAGELEGWLSRRLQIWRWSKPSGIGWSMPEPLSGRACWSISASWIADKQRPGR